MHIPANITDSYKNNKNKENRDTKFGTPSLQDIASQKTVFPRLEESYSESLIIIGQRAAMPRKIVITVVVVVLLLLLVR
jgi:hypothetical protein